MLLLIPIKGLEYFLSFSVMKFTTQDNMGNSLGSHIAWVSYLNVTPKVHNCGHMFCYLKRPRSFWDVSNHPFLICTSDSPVRVAVLSNVRTQNTLCWMASVLFAKWTVEVRFLVEGTVIIMLQRVRSVVLWLVVVVFAVVWVFDLGWHL